MNRAMADFRIAGMRELAVNLGRMSRLMYRASRDGLATAGMNIIADAQRNLKSNGTNNTGQLSNSGRVEEVKGYDAMDVGFFSNGKGYAEYVEYGRRAGKMPPVRTMVQWARKKLRLGTKESRSAGFLIARKIALKGTRPQPFFRPAYERHRQEITDTVANAVAKETR